MSQKIERKIWCVECKIEKPITDFYAYVSKIRPFVLKSCCKECWHLKDIKISREINRLRDRNYKERNPIKYKESQRRRHTKFMKKYLQNPINKLIANYRHQIRSALKSKSKSKPTLKLLGCTIKKFKIYLENQFEPGMTWDNYGQWHIDHIKPCACFDLSKKSEQQKCFHYTNLQPLWAKENLKKGSKYNEEKK